MIAFESSLTAQAADVTGDCLVTHLGQLHSNSAPTPLAWIEFQDADQVEKRMNLKLPELDDNPIGFDRWKTATEGYFFQEIQKFLFGSMERHLELFEGIRVATDIEAEVKANSI